MGGVDEGEVEGVFYCMVKILSWDIKSLTGGCKAILLWQKLVCGLQVAPYG